MCCYDRERASCQENIPGVDDLDTQPPCTDQDLLGNSAILDQMPTQPSPEPLDVAPNAMSIPDWAEDFDETDLEPTEAGPASGVQPAASPTESVECDPADMLMTRNDRAHVAETNNVERDGRGDLDIRTDHSVPEAEQTMAPLPEVPELHEPETRQSVQGDAPEAESDEPFTLGWRPTTDGIRPHCFIGGTGRGGIEADCAVAHGQAPDGAQLDVIRGRHRLGGFADERAGESHYGVSSQFTGFGADFPDTEDRLGGFDIDFLSTATDLHAGSDGVTAGVSASGVSVAGREEWSDGSQSRVGAGIGAGGRVDLNWGQQHPGIGIDAGWATFDHHGCLEDDCGEQTRP